MPEATGSGPAEDDTEVVELLEDAETRAAPTLIDWRRARSSAN